MPETIHIDIFVVLLLVTATVAITVKWIKLPYSISLVIVGLGIGLFHLLKPIELTPDLILLIFLPAVLFEASWNIKLSELKEGWKPITVLATLGVVINTIVVAYGMHYLAHVELGPAFLFGAMIAATDPISVLALFRKLGMDTKLTMLLEGESLFNDGTAVVLFKLVLACVIAGTGFSVAATAGNFLLVVIGGGVIGAILGYAASKITSLFDDHLLEITLTTILAYGSYLLAEQLHVSAVLSVVAAGVVIGNYGSRTGMSAGTRMAVNSFWEYLAFLVNSLIFLLIGLQVKFDLLCKYALQIGVGILVVLLARVVVVYGLAPFIGSRSHKIPWNWRHLLFWGALRGSVCMALALSLPDSFAYKEMITITTFGVVLFTLLIPGLTIEPLVTLLKMNAKDPKREQYKMLKAQLMAKKRALAFVSNQLKTGTITATNHDLLHNELQQAKEELIAQIENLHLEDSSIKALEEEELRHRILELEKDCYKGLVKDGALSEESLQKIELEQHEAALSKYQAQELCNQPLDSNTH
ncbi:MAG: Na+/H+ antiporter [Candidatus Obscuribacter sp.]|jgi:CPA1 family monovalent cation:H+ antiporter|nr:Na+/H+ antiporter [Candidatus Obscuribacter sp.]MBL0189572.1 Na+/H+ antiporter [Candidatus Obscuribacter sp.]MDQ5965980.1 Na+/H+ antiporter [Cyanobacteriota bacterium erpe_2018_sw_39hr_WHONDRS-SW48-000098_B_bin.30]